MGLDGRVALVTGAESGIGRATVRCLAARGTAVLGVGLRADRGAELEEEMRSAGLTSTFMVADVSTADGADAAVAAAIERFGHLDILVNCAGIIMFGSVEECTEDDWDRVLQVNLKSVYLMSRAAIPQLRQAGNASIVNIASAHAFATTDRLAAYATSKAAVVGLSRQMAIDCAPDGIRVNSVIVGAVDTEMARKHILFMGRDPAESAFVPGERRLSRAADPAEIAEAIAFLASPEASFVTGSALVADGGHLARAAG